MTTPVQMDYQISESGRLQSQEMAFFYGSREIGELESGGRVRVVDTEPIRVVSVGMRGSRSDESVREAHQRLRRWVANHPEYEAAGPLRVMGYNSPFIDAAKQFYEVQLPIREVEK